VPTAYPTEFYALGRAGQGDPDPGRRCRSFGPTLLAKVPGAQRHPGVQPRAGLPLRRLQGPVARRHQGPARRRAAPHLRGGQGRPQDLGGLSSATAGVILRELITFSDQGADAFFGLPEFDTADLLRTAPMGGDWCRCSSCPPCRTGRNCSPPSSCGCSRTSSTTCPRSATSTSPSWSSSSTRRTCSSTMRARTSSTDPADGAAHPLQGRRHLLRHPVAQGRARRRPRPARQPGPARLRAFTPDDAKALRTRSDLPQDGLRPGGVAHLARHRRGRHHGPVRAWCADPGRVDADAGAAVAHGAPRRMPSSTRR
jgi:hypothetical protein